MIAIAAQMSDHEQDRRSLDSVKFDISIKLPALPQTQFKDRFDVQTILNASQVAEIRNIINGIELAVADVERHRNHVQHILDQLDLRRTKLAALAFEHESFLAPIRLLPHELLSEIFEWSCALSYGNDHDFPVSLALVSRRWKAIALATPDIWANISIGEYTSGPRRRSLFASAHQSKMWLVRSANKALSVRLLPSEKGGNDSPPPEELVSECARWEYLNYSLRSRFLASFLPIQSHLPLLRSLVLKAKFDSMVLPPELDLFTTAPRLREVLICGHRNGKFNLPFHQLTSLTITRRLPMERWLNYLRLCPNLDVFEAGIRDTLDETTVDSGLYPAHNCLRALKARSHIWDLNPPFSKITLPALQILDLHDDEASAHEYSENPAQSIQPIADMVSRSGCAITTLRWSSQSRQDPIIDYLHTFPHLLHLDVSLDIGWISTFLERLTSQSPCPGLEILDIFVKGELLFHEEKSRVFQDPQPPLSGGSLDSQALIAFLRSGSHNLRRVCISDASLGSFEELSGHSEPPEIQTLRDEGMVILFGSKEVSEAHANRGIEPNVD